MKPRGLEAVAVSFLLVVAILASGCAVEQRPSPSPAPTNQPTTQASATARSPVAPEPSAVPQSGGAAAGTTPGPISIAWKSYASTAYGVTLQYPPEWQPKQGYDERYAANDGFFQVGALAGEGLSIDQAAETNAYHKLLPYGSQPRIERLEIQGHEARLILPSDDQPAQEEGLAALIVLAPRPIEVSTGQYRYLILWADKNHIRVIASTLRFTATALPSPPNVSPPNVSPTATGRRLNGPPSVQPSPRYEPPPLVADAALERDIRALLGPDLASYSVVVKRLADGRGTQINPERQYYAASLFKLLVMYEVFKQRQLGLLSFDEKLTITAWYLTSRLFDSPWKDGDEVPIQELLELMITESDNVAAMLLHDKVGGWNIIQDIRGVGLLHTNIEGDDMPTSARDMALWLEMIARGEAVDQQSSREMVDLLSQQHVRDRLPALLPEGVQVANKTGNWDNATHDVGIVYAPGGAYVIAVLSDRAWNAQPIAQLSRLVYDLLERTPSGPYPSPRPATTPAPASLPTAVATPPIAGSPTPSTVAVNVYLPRFLSNDVEFVPVERRVSRTLAIGRAAVEELLKGPTPEEKARGLSSSIPEGAKLRSLKIVDGVAYADFDEALQFQVGGSLRVMAIRKCITLTLLQFSTVKSVVISIEGRTEDILQP